MIRREVANDDSRPSAWLLISQIEHAQLAYRLAQHWGAGGVTPLVAGDELLWAIEHHDDGWRDWDRQHGMNPQHALVPEHGLPRSFTEMEVADSLAIWSGSIVVAAQHGPLAGYVVAGHFATLAKRVAAASGSAERRGVERFVKVQEDLMAQSLAAWQALDERANTLRQARLALAQLQFFDLLSLWFCCAEATEPDQVEPPGGPELTLSPRIPPCVQFAPWPFLAPQLELEVSARRVTATGDGDHREPSVTSAQPVGLRWLLQSGPRDA
jgi:hypothetical protein